MEKRDLRLCRGGVPGQAWPYALQAACVATESASPNTLPKAMVLTHRAHSSYSANTRLQNIRTRLRKCSVSKGPKRRISVTISEPADRLTKKGRPSHPP